MEHLTQLAPALERRLGHDAVLQGKQDEQQEVYGHR